MDETSHSLQEKLQKVLPFLIWLLFSAIIWYSFASDYVESGRLRAIENSLHYYTESHFTLSLFLYAAFAVFISTLTWPLMCLFALWGGFLFGPVFATLIFVPSVTLGSCFGFLLGKQAFDLSRHLLKHPGLENLKRQNQRADFWIILCLRLMPLIPFSITTLSAALLNLRLKDYLNATLLGTIPSVLFFTHFGSLYSEALKNPDQAWSAVGGDPFVLITFLCFSLGALLPIIFKWVRQPHILKN